MLDGFIRVAAASPKVRVADVDFNVFSNSCVRFLLRNNTVNTC